MAIATLGISEIIIYFLKFEDWLTRGVKNVAGLSRPVPYEVDLNKSAQFQEFAASIGMNAIDASSLVVKISYAILFTLSCWLFCGCQRRPSLALGADDAGHP